MTKAYLIAHIRVRDDEEFERFTPLFTHAVHTQGGTLLAQDAAPDVQEGSGAGTTLVVEFADLETARAFCTCDAYAAAKAVRETAADADVMLVAGH